MEAICIEFLTSVKLVTRYPELSCFDLFTLACLNPSTFDEMPYTAFIKDDAY